MFLFEVLRFPASILISFFDIFYSLNYLFANVTGKTLNPFSDASFKRFSYTQLAVNASKYHFLISTDHKVYVNIVITRTEYIKSEKLHPHVCSIKGIQSYESTAITR